jgi:enoyl-CoA hydratase/carnithine racemase
MSDAVLYEKSGFVATVTLNRPEKLNAWSVAMRQETADALSDAEYDPDIRAIILTGAGRAFCAGADMSEGRLEGRDSLLTIEYAAKGPSYVLAHMAKPVIAAINGVAVGAGFEITMGCDFRIMADSARLCDMHVNKGLLADAGAPWLLPRLVGWSTACEVMLLGEFIEAKQALEMRLVNRVVPVDQVMPVARELAERLASKAPLAVQAMKRLMREAQNKEQRPAMELSARMFRELQQSEDLKEGVRAYLEKRAPQWQGR